MNKIPVLYVGYQTGFDGLGNEPSIEGFHLVDEPSGSTKKYRPELHKIVGVSESAKDRGVEIPKDLL